jgi:hypothetical protein
MTLARREKSHTHVFCPAPKKSYGCLSRVEGKVIGFTFSWWKKSLARHFRESGRKRKESFRRFSEVLARLFSGVGGAKKTDAAPPR